MQREELVQALSRLEELPPMPDVVSRIEVELSSPDAAPERVARIIEQDAALVSSVLRLANSAYFAMRGEVSTVLQATLRLGLDEIWRVAVAAALVRQYCALTPGDRKSFWAHSMAVAMTTRGLANMARLPLDSAAMGRAYLAGLLHDIGAMALRIVAPEASVELADQVRSAGVTQAELQRERWGIDYAEAGGILARAWRLPDHLSEAIRFHLSPADASAQHRSVVQLVHLADFVCINQGFGRGDEGFADAFDEAAWRDLGLDIQQVPLLIAEGREQGQQARSLVDLILSGLMG